jgi:F0F1-type ATP synthase membrane subunit b/b'
MQIELRPDYSLLVIAVIFLLNYLIVRNFFFKPINRILSERETEVSSAQKQYEEALNRFNEATAEIEAKIHQARREGSTVREGRRVEAVQHRAGLIERTRKESEQIVGAATASLGKDVTAARDLIVGESEQLARLAAEKILGRRIG